MVTGELARATPAPYRADAPNAASARQKLRKYRKGGPSRRLSKDNESPGAVSPSDSLLYHTPMTSGNNRCTLPTARALSTVGTAGCPLGRAVSAHAGNEGGHGRAGPYENRGPINLEPSPLSPRSSPLPGEDAH